MPFTFHTHSGQFCNHAHGTLEEVIESAKSKKFHTIGLSEHIPRTRAKDLYPEESHLTPPDLFELFENYVEEARRLKALNENKINIIIGAETEYITPEATSLIEELRSKYSLDYVVGSLHHVKEIPIDFDKETYQKALDSCGGDYNELYSVYFDAQYELITRIKPEVIGHFDLIRIFSPKSEQSLADRPEVWAKVQRNIDAAIKYNAIFEINSRAWKKGLPNAYPLKDVLQELINRGAKFTISDDSHGPRDVGLYYSNLFEYLKTMNIKTLSYFVKDSDNDVLRCVELTDALNHPFWTLNGYNQN
ncbi:hypothetical protein H4219_004189 [Mycoemilia scoparia]|uniref:Histidinol-phosphatase n=1 Tax=Mycoemilia scoparia TaxID=417184 RepID=A0A9W8A0I6_9FUNG|nr:hypothetical protein H4219_004189 [Mycoemilia scoparia]